jgi:hypothetical protein
MNEEEVEMDMLMSMFMNHDTAGYVKIVLAYVFW